MNEPLRPKPLPARPSFPAPAHGAPGTHEPSPPAVAPGPANSGAPTAQTAPDVQVVGRGGTWRVKVLGKAGRGAARSAPILLLGFTRQMDGGPSESLEMTVAGRALTDLSQEALEAALARAIPPPADDRKRPFFEDADRTAGPRKGGPNGL